MYTQAEFMAVKKEIVEERDRTERKLAQVRDELDGCLLATERTFNFCAFALHRFETGDFQKKRAIFSTVGSNLILKDKKLTIERLHPYILIENELANQKKLREGLERKKTLANKESLYVSVPNKRSFDPYPI